MRVNIQRSATAIVLAFCLTGCSSESGNTKQALAATAAGDLDTAIELVNKGVTVNGMNEKGYTLLHLSEDAALTSLLIEKGHNVNLQSGGMFTQKEKDDFLDGRKAVAGVSQKMKESLSDIDENDPYFGENLSPLHTVKDADTVEALLEAGANPNAISLYEATPISEVRSLGSLKHLIDAGATMQPANYNRSPLHQFFDNNDIRSFPGGEDAYFSAVKLFVEASVDLTIKDNGDSNVLHAANYKATPQMLTYLLKSGADPKLDDGNWGGAFCLAIKESKDELLLPYVSHDFTLLYHKCDGDRLASVYAKEEAKFNTTYPTLIKMEEIVKAELQKP